MDNSQAIMPQAILAIPHNLGDDHPKLRNAAINHLREISEMFDAITSNGTTLPSSTDTEFYAAEHDGRMIRFYFDDEGGIIVSLQNSIRTIFTQFPNLADFSAEGRDEDDITQSISAMFTQIDDLLVNSQPVTWHPVDDSIDYLEMESCELTHLPGLLDLFSGTRLMAVAAIRREMPTTYKRMVAGCRQPHLVLRSDFNGLKMIIGDDVDDNWAELFSSGVIAQNFTMPTTLALAKCDDGYLKLSHMRLFRFCPKMPFSVSPEEFDNAYEAMGDPNDLSPRTTYDARDYDLDLSDGYYEALDDYEIDQDEAYSEHNLENLLGDPLSESEADFLRPAAIKAPKDHQELCDVIAEFIGTVRETSGAPSEVLITLPINKRIEYFLALHVSSEIFSRLEKGEKLAGITPDTLLLGENLTDEVRMVTIGEITDSISLAITKGLRGSVVLDYLIQDGMSEEEALAAYRSEDRVFQDIFDDPRSQAPGTLKEIAEHIRPLVSETTDRDDPSPLPVAEAMKICTALSMAEELYRNVSFGMPIEAVDISELFDIQKIRTFIRSSGEVLESDALSSEGIILGGLEASVAGYHMILEHLGEDSFEDS